ncbi:MAG: DUF6438 domain-containing protein [Bacteroidota bacterium]
MKKILSSIVVMLILAQSVMGQGKKISTITMGRTPCMGRCQVYDIELHANGKVIYTGRQFVKHMGVYEKNIGKKTIAKLFAAFSKYQIDTCQNEYSSNLMDGAGMYYIIDYGSNKKEIQKAHFGPAKLEELAQLIDKTIQVNNKWKKTASIEAPLRSR